MKRYYILLFILLVFIPKNIFAKESIELKECVDGDTAKFIIDNETYTVRFLAINTEESVSSKELNTFMGKVASFYTCFRLKSASKIKIEYDANAEKEDKYGRKLGWIFVDGDLLQLDLIEKGLAEVDYLYDEYKYTEKLQDAQSVAKDSNIGIWNEDNIIEKIYNFYQKFRKLFT